MISTRVIQGVIMPGGWHYLQNHNGVQIRLEAASHLELLSAVQLWRSQNGVMIGDVEKDVEQYICNNFPRQCRIGSQATPIPQIYGVAHNRFIDRIMQWIMKIRGNPKAQTFVPKEIANKRADICASCSENIEWANSCGSCVSNAKALLGLIRQGRDTDTPYWPRLKGCMKNGWDNRTSIWLSKEALADQGSPDNCWMRKDGL